MAPLLASVPRNPDGPCQIHRLAKKRVTGVTGVTGLGTSWVRFGVGERRFGDQSRVADLLLEPWPRAGVARLPAALLGSRLAPAVLPTAEQPSDHVSTVWKAGERVVQTLY